MTRTPGLKPATLFCAVIVSTLAVGAGVLAQRTPLGPGAQAAPKALNFKRPKRGRIQLPHVVWHNPNTGEPEAWYIGPERVYLPHGKGHLDVDAPTGPEAVR